MASWRESELVGEAVRETADRIIEAGFPAERRHDLHRWLVWLAFNAVHPDAYEHSKEARQ